MAYNDQQSRLAKAFNGERSMCVLDCQCGRVHFVSAHGHGDYDDGELEDLQAKRKEQPEKYIEEFTYDYVEAVYVDGKTLVVDCPCEQYKRYCGWIESHAKELANYLAEYFKDKAADSRRELQEADKAIADLESRFGLK